MTCVHLTSLISSQEVLALRSSKREILAKKRLILALSQGDTVDQTSETVSSKSKWVKVIGVIGDLVYRRGRSKSATNLRGDADPGRARRGIVLVRIPGCRSPDSRPRSHHEYLPTWCSGGTHQRTLYIANSKRSAVK